MKQLTIFCIFLFFSQLGFSQTVAHFSIDKRKGCQPLTVNFVDSSYGGTVTKRDWDLSGQLVPNQVNVGKNFTNAGKFTIKLTVTFSNGDVRIAYDTIHVYPLPTADFILVNAVDTAGCVSHKIQLKSLSTTATGTITKYSWDFGGGGTTGTDPTPYFTYANPGKYNVSLIVENNYGCKSNAATRYNYIKVFPVVNAAFTIKDNFSCDTSLLSSFINTTTGGDGLTYKWMFGDGDSLVVTSKDTVKHLYKNPGNYIVKLIVTNASNCKGVYTTPNDKRVFVGRPKASIACPDTVCANTNIALTGSSVPPAYTYKWIISDHNNTLYGATPTYKFDTPGKYTITLVASNYVGCSDTVKKEIVVKAGPVADFTMDQNTGCSVPFPVQFTYSGTGTGFTYDWNFGDGTPHSNLQSPSHTYANPGYYTVSLTVTDPSTGCVNFIQKNSVIGISIPQVDFNYVPQMGCKPLKVTVIAKVDYLFSPLKVSRYIWDFGDGTIIDTTLATFSHIYYNTGTYNIRLKIITSNGCEVSSTAKQVVVIDLCDDDGSGGDGGGAGGFNIGKSCADKYLVTFTDTVKNSKTLQWDFGDGIIVNTGKLNPIVHQYSPPKKIYTVIITRRDTVTNITSTAQKRIVIIDEKANFSADIRDLCKGMQVNFKTIGMDSSKIKKYTWDYGDQTPRNVIDNASYYSQTGKYLNGNASHVYLKNGNFFPKLIIEDKLGCVDSMIYPVPVNVQGPVAGFIASPLKGCGQKLEVTFTDTSKQNGTIPIEKWIWNFGDGTPVYTTTNDTVFKHVYNGASSYNAYTVTLKVVDSIGCESEEIRLEHIKRYYPRAALYSYDTLLCGKLNVNLYNASYAYNATYNWDFGDGTTANSYHASHTYAQNGLYTIKLVVKDANNCVDSITKPQYIKLVKPKADFIIGDTSQCAPVSIVFKDNSQYATSYHWFFDGADGGTDKDPSPHIYGEPGYYKVTLAIKGVSDCIDTISKIIHIKGPIAKLNVNTAQGCVPYAFHIGVTGTNIKSYAWDFGDGTPVIPSSDSAVNHLYINSGKYLPNAILTSPEGCVVTLKSKDTVIVDELHADFLTAPYSACDSASVEFIDKSMVAPFSTITQSKWFFGDGSTASGPLTGPHVYTSPGMYSVSLMVSSKYGCVDTLTKQDSIQVWKSPEINIKGDSLICLRPGSLLNYQSVVNNTDTALTYSWSINDVPVTTEKNLSYYLRERGYHELKLQVSNSHQCSAVIKKVIFIDSVKTHFSVNALSFCGTGTVELKNETQSATAIDTAIWDLGNGVKLKGVDTTYTYTVPGTYVIKLTVSSINGCSDSSVTTQPVHVYALPQASIVSDSLFCASGILNFSSQVITQDSVSIREWALDNGQPLSGENVSTYVSAGIHAIQLRVKTQTGCWDTIVKKIVVDSMKADFMITTPYLCDKTDTARFSNLSYAASGVSGYTWYFGDGTSDTTATPTHVYSKPPGIYDVLLIVNSASGCRDSVYKKASIQQYARPLVSIQSDTGVCKGQALILHSSIVSGDSIKSMKWLIDSVLTDTTKDLKHTFSGTGTHTIQFGVTSVHGCVADTNMQITVHPLPVPAVTADTTVCKGTTVQLLAHDGMDYKWLPVTALNNAAIANPLATPDSGIHYVVEVRNIFGCLAKDSVSIRIDQPVKIRVKEVAPICSGETISLEAVANTTVFLWTPATGLSNPAIANPLASPAVTTVYQVKGFSLNTCPNDSATVKVDVGEIPELSVVTDTAVVAGSTIQLFSSVTNVPVTYLWQPDDGLSCTDCADPFAINIRENRQYILTVTSSYGCTAMDTVNIRTFCEDDLLIPNAFTPNGDNLNDVFYPQAPGYGMVRSMVIYNRWGEQIFSQENFPLNDPVYGWNGTYKNEPIQGTHVFVYVIRLKCANGNSTAITGKVTLIR
jgi:gliding motility-associated-like protein